MIAQGGWLSGEPNNQPHSINYNPSTGKWDFNISMNFEYNPDVQAYGGWVS